MDVVEELEITRSIVPRKEHLWDLPWCYLVGVLDNQLVAWPGEPRTTVSLSQALEFKRLECGKCNLGAHPI